MRDDVTGGPWNWLCYPDGRKLLAAPEKAVIHCPFSPMEVSEGDRVAIESVPEYRQALRAVADALQANGHYRFDGTWNPDAHIELTLTVAECGRILSFFAADESGEES